MDVLRPQLVWVGNCCYRRNPLRDESRFNSLNEDGHTGPFDEDCYDDEVCEVSAPVEKLDDGRFRVSVSLASEYYPRIIGKNADTKKQIEKETRTTVLIPRRGQKGDVVITGMDSRGVVSAYNRIMLLVAGMRKRMPFTHFLSIPLAANTQVKSSMAEFKEQVLNITKRWMNVNADLFQKADKLHLTVGTLVLLDDEERIKAAQTLADCRDKIRTIIGSEPLQMQIEGIEIMNDDPEAVHVLYAKCRDPSGRMQKVADLLVDSFVSSGLMQRQYDHVKLHATLMNTLFTAVDDDERTRQTFNAKAILETLKDYKFGTEVVDRVHLSQRHSTCASTGYYVATSQLEL